MKSKLEQNSGLKGIRTDDLCDAGAVLNQLSYQANLSLGVGIYQKTTFMNVADIACGIE